MKITIGIAALITEPSLLRASYEPTYVLPVDEGYPNGAPDDGRRIVGNSYSDSRVMVRSAATTLGLDSLMYDWMQGLLRDIAYDRAQRVEPWMLARVQAHVAALIAAYPTPTERQAEALVFGQWLAYWMNYALTGATTETPAALLVQG